MTMVAVVNSSSALKNIDVSFLVEAVQNQVIEFCKTWGLDPWAVTQFGGIAGLPTLDVYVFEYVDKLDVDGALAYHSVDASGRPYGRMLPPSDPLDATDLSHEVLEALGDPTCDRWMKRPDGTEVAVEVCDPVQGDEYAVAATVLGETRQIKLSNYVWPAFFDASSSGPFDRQGTVKAPFGMSSGGYEAVIDPSGNEHDVFARLIGSSASAAPKLHDAGSRLMLRLKGRWGRLHDFVSELADDWARDGKSGDAPGIAKKAFELLGGLA